MLGSLFEDLKARVDGMVKLVFAGAIAGGAAAAAFICFAVALFLWMQQGYGTLEAWLALAAFFAAIAAIGAIVLLTVRRRMEKAAPARKQEPASPVARLLQEPAVLVTGLQMVRMLGARGILPILVLGVVAGGFLMGRNGQGNGQGISQGNSRGKGHRAAAADRFEQTRTPRA